MGGRPVLLPVVLLCLLLIHSHSATSELEGFGDDHGDGDEGDEQGVPYTDSVVLQSPSASVPTWDADEFEGFEPEPSEPAPDTPQAPAPRTRRRTLVKQDHYWFELAALVAIVIYGINIFLGKRRNERVALTWVKSFCTPSSIMDKNFSLLGPGDGPVNELLMKESNSTFKFYASGRRHCQSLMATVDLRARHDLIKLGFYLAFPRTDIVNIEVAMNEASMPPIVLAVATPELLKTLQKQFEDLDTFTKQISVPKNRLPNWPSKELQVLTEHSSVFYDIFSDPRIDSVFSVPSDLPLFRYLHFSSEHTSEGAPKRGILRFSFALPPPEDMQQLARLMAVVPVFIDVLGGYKMAAEVLKKAAKARADVADKAFKEGQAQRQEALAQKKMQKIQAERERVKAMGPEARAKWQEKQEKAAAKGRFKIRKIK